MIYFEPILFFILYFVITVLLCLVILGIAYIAMAGTPNIEKGIAYECGFKPFTFIYYPFDVQFYRIGILFLLFDIEIIFFFPWVLNFYQITYVGHINIIIFLGIILIGFVYELISGALQWYPLEW